MKGGGNDESEEKAYSQRSLLHFCRRSDCFRLLAAHLQHECPGEGCPVCAAISGWERLLRGMALAAALESALLLARRALGACVPARLNGMATHTLVALKVKLSD